MRYVKMFGIQRTGTNFIQQILRQNYKNVRALDNQFGWKHGTPLSLKKIDIWIAAKPNRKKYYPILNDIKSGNLMYPCFIIKNPYSWHQSIKKWNGSKFNLEKSYKRYNLLYTSYRNFYEEDYKSSGLYRQGIIIRYEDVLKDTQRVISEIAKSFGLEPKGNFVIPNKVPQSANFDEDRKKFYLGSGTFDLPSKIVQKINSLVDWNLMAFYGYTKKGE